LFYNDVSSVINRSLNNLGLNLIQISDKSVPISDRWLYEYTIYAENNFSAIGDIHVNSTISGSYLLPSRTTVNSLTLDQIEVPNIPNTVLYNITVEGQASVEVHSTQLISNSSGLQVPNYFLFQFDNYSANIKSVDDGLLKITSDRGTFVVDEASFASNNTSFIVHSPFIDMNGTVNFSRISLPSVVSTWLDGVELQGRTRFHIGYGDSQYIFLDNFGYPSWQPSTPKIDAVPLKDILLSPFNITFLILLGVVYFASSKRYLYLSQSTA
jgi:hypothetical protein